MPATPRQLFDLLASLGIETQTRHHDAVFTVAQSSLLHDDIGGGHTKNLFVKDKKGNHFLIVAPAHARIEMNRLHALIGATGRLSFASTERLMELLGVAAGSVTAFAPVNDVAGRVKVVIDAALLRDELLNCHPLTNTMTTTISTVDLLAFLDHVGHKPDIVAISANDATVS